MGLSASQARLLSITQRISNNELQSQFLSHAKINLSQKNTLATEKYIAALDGTEMQYVHYNETGNVETIALTFDTLMAYSPLKNQYNLYNAQGQLLVSEDDARKFETSSTLSEFLMKNGLDQYWASYNEELVKYNAAYDNYLDEMETYKTDYANYEASIKDYYENQVPAYERLMEQYNEDVKDYNNRMAEYQIKLDEYNLIKNAPNLYSLFSNAVVSNSHYTAAKNNNPGCFLHVLNNLIDYTGTGAGLTASTYNTSAKDASGNVIKLTDSDEFQNNSYSMPNLAPIAQGMKDPTYGHLYLCDGNDVGTSGGKENNLLKQAIDNGQTPSVYAQLASDYVAVLKDDGTYDYERKTLYQKTIDMYYLLANCKETYTSRGGFGDNEFTLTQNGVTVASFLTDYVEGDMKGLEPEEPEEPKNEAELPAKPNMPQPPKHPLEPTFLYESNYPVEDKEKAQWYTNLWHAMDGHDTTAQIGVTADTEGTFQNFKVPDARKESDMKIIKSKTNADGSMEILEAIQLNNYYVVVPKEKATDSSWLQHALSSGTFTMKHASLRSTGDVTWEGIEFSSTSDIREVKNDAKVAKAEAEYKEAIAQIQSEDKMIDAKNKKLDTEHSALKAEIDSIKNVMSKNIEKSFTAFS